jgi:flavin reductase (DIM6/NTAB) family NADH-FMN oxidoreductase RutF
VSPYLSQSVTESPVGLVITEAGARRNAMTVSFFSEVAHFPTSLWVSIAKNSFTHGLLLDSRRFSLILLHRKQAELAQMCGTVSGREQDKCDRLSLYRGRDNFLFVPDALTCTGCEVRATADAGDHTVFLANILCGELDSLSSVRRHLLTVDLV